MKLPSFFLFTVLSFILSCGKDHVDGTLRLTLQGEYDRKLTELKEKTRNHVAGWPSDDDCDAALWAGVASAAGAEWVDVSAALQPDGRPTRKPFKDCIVPSESASTTSNDMITGIILGLLVNKDAKSILSLYRYGERNNWIMGEPITMIARVLLRPNGIILMARSLYKLSDGGIDYLIRLSPTVYGPVQSDYEGHLILLSRYISKLAGGPQYGTEVAETLISLRDEKDALAQAMAKNYFKASSLLLNDYKSPSYVRGHDNYHLVHWLLAASIVLNNT